MFVLKEKLINSILIKVKGKFVYSVQLSDLISPLFAAVQLLSCLRGSGGLWNQCALRPPLSLYLPLVFILLRLLGNSLKPTAEVIGQLCAACSAGWARALSWMSSRSLL